jgi:hypothetical protein
MRRTVAAGLALVLTASLIACSGDDDDAPTATTVPVSSTTSSTTTSTTAEEPTTTTATADDDEPELPEQEAAEAVVLTGDDLPAGYVAEPEDEGDDNDQVDRCVPDADRAAFEELRDVDTGNAESPQFRRQDQTSFGIIQSGANLWASADEAAAAFDIVTGPAFAECVSAALEESFAAVGDQADVILGDSSIAPLPAPGGAEESAASRLTVPLTVAGTDLTTAFDVVFARQGRTLLFLVVAAAPQPPDAALTTQLVTTMAGRAPA